MALENQTDSPVNQRWCISFKLNMFLDSFEHELGLLILHNKRSRHRIWLPTSRLPRYDRWWRPRMDWNRQQNSKNWIEMQRNNLWGLRRPKPQVQRSPFIGGQHERLQKIWWHKNNYKRDLRFLSGPNLAQDAWRNFDIFQSRRFHNWNPSEKAASRLLLDSVQIPVCGGIHLFFLLLLSIGKFLIR